MEDDILEKLNAVQKIENLSTINKTIKFLLNAGYDKYINQDEIDTLKIVKDNSQKLNSISDAQDEILIKISEVLNATKNK